MENKVYITRCNSYNEEEVSAAVSRALSEFGGAKELAGGKRVLIKVNLLMSSAPDKAVTTHPSVIKALAKEFISAGCHVEIADSCGGLYNRDILNKLYAVCGMKRVAEETGAELNYDTSSFEREIPEGKKLKKAQIISPVGRADFIISAAKLKTHGLTYYTGAVKNMFGTIPGVLKAAMHSRFPDKKDFCEMLVDLCESINPDLSIIDGIVGMEGAGPSGGSPKAANSLIVSQSPYAADVAGIRIMGLDLEKSEVHKAAQRRGLVSGIELCGTDISELVTSFEPAYKKDSGSLLSILPGVIRKYVNAFTAAHPYILREKCVGCGECVRDCPEKTISIVDKKASINYKNCIRCYCCQEMCPARAIEIKRFARFKRK